MYRLSTLGFLYTITHFAPGDDAENVATFCHEPLKDFTKYLILFFIFDLLFFIPAF